MSDELKRYKKQIKDELMNGLHSQMHIQNKVQGGGSGPGIGAGIGGKKLKKIHKGVCSKCQKLCPSCNSNHNSDSDSDSDSDENEIIGGGGKGFVRSMKKLGRQISHNKIVKGAVKGIVKTGKTVGNEIKKEGTKYVVNGLKDMAIDATAAVAANPELLLLAAGVKKPKQKRVPSAKQTRRHELIRQLMKENNCSLAEASSHIKQHNLQ